MAEIIVKCENCGIDLAAPEELIGQEVRCYGCQTLQVIKAPEPMEPDVPVLQAPKPPEPVEAPPEPAEVAPPPEPAPEPQPEPPPEPKEKPEEAPAFSPMMEISPDNELEMPEPTPPPENPTTETATNLNAIPNPLDDLKPESEEAKPEVDEIPTLSVKTQVSQKPDDDGIPTLSLKKEPEEKATPEPPPEPESPAPAAPATPEPDQKPAAPVPEEVTFHCVGCQSILVAPGEHIGYNVRCDKCDHKMPVPEKSNATIPRKKPHEPKPTTPKPTPEPPTAEEKIPLPTPSSGASIPVAPIADDDDDDNSIPKLRKPTGHIGTALPKAPIALDDGDDDDKNIPKLRPPPTKR